MAIKLKLFVDLINRDKKLQNSVGKFITRAVNKSARVMEKNIKDSATISFTQRNGHLRKSVRARENTGFGKAEVVINPVDEGADVNYGIYLEYGTKYIAPRGFIRRGASISEKKIKEVFAEEGRNAIKRIK